MTLRKYLPLLLSLILMPLPALAADVNAGDTAWMLVSTALVLIMTPGLAYFYGGMVRSKNAASTLYQNFIPLAVIGILWVIIGFSFAFCGDGAYFGDNSKTMLEGVGQTPDATYGSTIPYLLFVLFQMMFAIITPALMTGAFAERVNFRVWVAFMIIWSLVVYCPVAHWVWSPKGWLFAKGALDFAGGFVVHMTAGFSALVAALVFGKRRDFGTLHKPHDIAHVLLGTTLLWFGWFGFNAGSALTAGGLATQAFATSFLAAAAAMLSWTTVDTLKDGKPTLMGGCVGVVAGLVAITPAAGFVTIGSAILIGVLAGFVCNLAARIIKGKFKIDDTLDVFACHGIGGLLGCIMTGLLATKTVNAAGGNGFFNNDLTVITANLQGAVAVGGYSMIATYIILKVLNAAVSIRVSDADEQLGLDQSQHGETINSAV